MSVLTRETDEVREHVGRPGWDIVADLTPPELLDLRSLAVLQRRIVAGLVLVLVLCAAGYGYTTVLHRHADQDAAAADQRSAQLNRAVQEYSGITRIETTVSTMAAQQASLLSDDVDVPRVVSLVRTALPASMSIANVSVTVTGGSDGAAGTDTTGTSGSSTSGLDASGHSTIGTVSVTGSGRSLDDLPSFVDRLSTVRGFADVLPASNQVDKHTSQFSVTLALTDVLYTHRYDVTSGAK